MKVVYLENIGVYGVVVDEGKSVSRVQYALDGTEYTTRVHRDDYSILTEEDLI